MRIIKCYSLNSNNSKEIYTRSLGVGLRGIFRIYRCYNITNFMNFYNTDSSMIQEYDFHENPKMFSLVIKANKNNKLSHSTYS